MFFSLLTALENNSTTVKKQIIDLLSALCVYSPEGYARAIDSIEHYQVRGRVRHDINVISHARNYIL